MTRKPSIPLQQFGELPKCAAHGDTALSGYIWYNGSQQAGLPAVYAPEVQYIAYA